MEKVNVSEATKELFELYGDAVYRYARFVLGNALEAEDAVQEIFLQVLKSWVRFEHRSSPKTWLWKIANNHIKTMLRKRKYQFVELSNEFEIESQASNSTEFLIDLERDIIKLPLPQRQVFIYRILHDISSSETAQILGWSDARVRITLHRAIQSLRSKIQTRESAEL